MSTAIPVDPAAVAGPAVRSGRLRRVAGGRLRIAACAVAVAAVAGGLAYLGTWPPLAVVESGSMAPTINTGDVVVLKRLDRAPRVGDVVAVDVPEEARSRYGYPAVVVHRVVRVAPNGDLTTKGDARRAADPFTVRRVNERVVLTIPAAGRALGFLTSTLGLVWLGLGAVLLLGLPMLERRRDAEAMERGSIAQLHDELRSLSDELGRMRDDSLSGSRLHESIDALARDAQANRQRLDEIASALAPQPRAGASQWDRLARVLATLERPAFTQGDGSREARWRAVVERLGSSAPVGWARAADLDFAPRGWRGDAGPERDG
jgi:signal peptidase I